jgi:hypothetical protein
LLGLGLGLGLALALLGCNAIVPCIAIEKNNDHDITLFSKVTIAKTIRNIHGNHQPCAGGAGAVQ